MIDRLIKYFSRVVRTVYNNLFLLMSVFPRIRKTCVLTFSSKYLLLEIWLQYRMHQFSIPYSNRVWQTLICLLFFFPLMRVLWLLFSFSILCRRLQSVVKLTGFVGQKVSTAKKIVRYNANISQIAKSCTRISSVIFLYSDLQSQHNDECTRALDEAISIRNTNINFIFT